MGGALLYFLSFVQLILILGGAYLAGYFFTRIFKRIEFVRGVYALLFVRLLLGLVIIVMLYSVFITRFLTVNIGLLFLTVAWIYELRKSKNPGDAIKRIRWGELQWFGIFIATLFFFLWFAHLIIRGGNGFEYRLADKDKVYYAGIAEMLSFGQENRAGVNNLFGSQYNGVAPYHYFELWITNIVSILTGKPAVACLYLFVYPLLCSVSALGLLAGFEKFTTIKWWHPLMCAMLMFAGGTRLHFNDPNFIFTINFAETPMECLGEKYAVYYPFILLCFLFWLEKKIIPAIIVLLMLSIASVSVVPGLFPALLLFVGTAVFKKWIPVSEFVRLICYSLFTLVFFGIFYSCFGISENAYMAHNIFYYSDLNTFSLQSFKIFIIELLVRIWQKPFLFAFLHLPFLLLVAWLWFADQLKNGIRQMLLLMILIYLSSLFAYGSFYKVFDGVQFYVNNLVFANVLISFALILFLVRWNQFSLAKRLIGIFFVIFLCAKTYFALSDLKANSKRNQFYSQNYLDAVKRMSDTIQSKQLVAAFYDVGGDEIDVRNADKSGVNALHFAFLQQFYPVLDLTSVNIKTWSDEKEVAEVQMLSAEQTPFAKFVTGQKSKGIFKSTEESQIDFIRHKGIHYVLISAKSNPNAFLEKLISGSIADAKSGERFAHLNY